MGVRIILSFLLLDFDSCLSTRNNIRVCDVVEKHVLTLEVDLVAFCKVLFPLVKQSVLEDTHP
jgi:hypothetical protein